MSEENLNQTEETTAKAEVAKKKKKNLNTVLLILSILFLVVGVLCLLVEPYKAWRRRTISAEAVEAIQSEIEDTMITMGDDAVVTYVVPKNGNEVAGETYDYYGLDDVAQSSLEAEIEENEENLPDDIVLECVGILDIDKIDVHLPIWDGTSKYALRYGVGLYEGSVTPGEDGNSSILGHHARDTKTIFYRIGELKVGDTFTVTLVSGRVLTFKINKIKIVPPSELIENIEADAAEDVKQCTLVTCVGEYGVGYRMLFIAEMVDEEADAG